MKISQSVDDDEGGSDKIVSRGPPRDDGMTSHMDEDFESRPELLNSDDSSDDNDGVDVVDSRQKVKYGEKKSHDSCTDYTRRNPILDDSSHSFADESLRPQDLVDSDCGEEDGDDEPQIGRLAPEAPAAAASSLDKVVEEEEGKKQGIGPYTRREYTFAICAGSVMAFNSGYVNGSCLTGFIAPSGRRQATASLTGTTSRSALALADGSYEDFGFMIGMVLSFMIGACISGLMTPRPTPFRMEPTYGPTFLLGAAFLVLSSILAAFEMQDHFIFFLAAAANGIQNGISSIYSKNLIRSTGYTGAITDISIVLAQISQGNRENAWKLGVLVTLLTSFWIGGTVSYFSAKRFTSFSLLINAGIFVTIGGSLVAFLMIEFGISLRQAVLGTWKWQKAMQSLHGAFMGHTSIFGPDAMNHGNGFGNNNADGEDSCTLTRMGASSSHSKSLGFLTDRHLNQIFTRLDKDNSNTLDGEELLLALRNAGMDVSKKDCEVMMRLADENGDGVLSRDEWIHIARQCEKKPKKGALVAKSWHESTHRGLQGSGRLANTKSWHESTHRGLQASARLTKNGLTSTRLVSTRPNTSSM